jgi:hypothetical protein
MIVFYYNNKYPESFSEDVHSIYGDMQTLINEYFGIAYRKRSAMLTMYSVHIYGGFIKGILRGVRCTKSLRVLFLHRRPPSWTTLVLYSRALFIFNEPANTVPRVQQCLSPRRNWDPPQLHPQASGSLPPEPKGGGHTGLRVRGWESPKKMPMRRKSLALCLLRGPCFV